MRNKICTIKDIAKAAGVSIATVSRAINGNYPVSRDARDRIENAVRELNYKPNTIARSLKNDCTHTIGLLVPDIANPFFMNIAKAVENEVSKNGYNIIVCSTEENEDKEINYLHMLLGKRIDGLLLSTSGQSDKLVQEIKSVDIPLILIDRSIKGLEFDTITDDNVEGAYLLTKYLIGLGHVNIALIDGPDSISTGSDRLAGYLKAYGNAGLKVRHNLIYNGSYTQEYGYKTAIKLLKQDKGITAIFAANNLIAKGVLIAAREMGKSIPDDFSLVCFGDDEFSKLIVPSVTCIIQDPLKIGAKAGKLIQERINSPDAYKPRNIVSKNRFFIGDSCKEIGR